MDTTIWIVIGAAMITATMTGAGALPFLFVKKLSKRVIGWSNAAATGLMLAASHSLVAEGNSINVTLTLTGFLAGLGAIYWRTGCFRVRAMVRLLDVARRF